MSPEYPPAFAAGKGMAQGLDRRAADVIRACARSLLGGCGVGRYGGVWCGTRSYPQFSRQTVIDSRRDASKLIPVGNTADSITMRIGQMDNMKKQAAVSVSVIGNELAVSFANGHVERIDVDALDEGLRYTALCHGLKQKIVDAAAMSRNTETGAPASAEEKRQACIAVIERLRAGHWNAERGSGEGTGSGSLLFRALCIAYPAKTPEQVKGFMSGLDKKQQAALRANPRIAGIIDGLRAKTASDVDSDELLDALDA